MHGSIEWNHILLLEPERLRFHFIIFWYQLQFEIVHGANKRGGTAETRRVWYDH